MNAAEIFQLAIELKTPAEREDYVAKACGDDTALRAKVDALLKSHDEAGSFLEQSLFAAQKTLDLPALGERPGTVIGPYKLLQQIGEGGMGVVFMAEQMEPVQRKVALKIIKPGMDSSQVIARFEAERQALAMMDHVNIARVLDAGATKSGRPYFAMELVHGVPITKYCDDNHLSPRERLELFISVCQAIQHAHQKGIIHRDIKPSNVMITLYDGKPVAKVIDFGVAKATERKLTERTLFTQYGTLVGTLEYMSPEQAEMSALGVDTRSDIYSLGVLLYELLTGTTPLSRERLKKAAFAEILRMIKEEEPPKPSTRLSDSGEALASISANRHMEPAKLTKLLRGELDWIVMKTLEKDRNRRYETANGFAADLQRYLADEAVLAGPPTTGYKLRKFLRRNRSSVLVASVILLSLVGGIIGTTLGLFEARRQEKAAVEAAEKEKKAHAATAEAEADTKAFADFLANHILAATRPEGVQYGVGRNVTMEEALLKAELKLAEVFNGHPKAEALARHEIGVTWRNLGKYADAVRHLRRALALRQELYGENAEITIQSMNSLAVALGRSGHAIEAVPLHERALKIRQKRLGTDHPDTLLDLSNLGIAYREAGNPSRALQLFKELLERYKAVLGIDHPNTLRCMQSLGTSYRLAGNYGLALPLLKEALDRMKTVLGPNHPDTLAAMNGLGLAYRDVGQVGQAVPLIEESLRRQHASLGPDHPQTLQSTIILASVYQAAGQIDKAMPLFTETLVKQRAILGSDHPETLDTMYNLALAYKVAGQLDRALPVLEEALKRSRAALSPDHPSTLQGMSSLGGAYRDVGQPDRALPLLEEAVERQTATLGPDHPNTLSSLNNLAMTLKDLGRVDRSLQLLETSLERHRTRFGPDHPNTLQSLNNLAAAYQDSGQVAKAMPMFEEALAKQQASRGRDHPVTLHTMNLLALAYATAGKLDRAVPLFEETLEKRRAALLSGHPDTLTSVINLAHAYGESGKLDQSLPLFENALKDLQSRLSAGHPRTRSVMAALADCHERMNNPARAEPLRREIADILKRQGGDDSPPYAGQLALLGWNLLLQKKFSDAEVVLRNALAIRQAKEPDAWSTFNTQSLLGGALLAQKKYADAEPLLLAGYEGMQQRQAKIPPVGRRRLPDALERLVQLYDGLGQPDKAAKWRTKLEAQRAAGVKPMK